MSGRRRRRIAAAVIGAALVGAGIGLAVTWRVGTRLAQASPASVGVPPTGLAVEDVRFGGEAGHELSGWFFPGSPGRGAVVLMHGVHANRAALVGERRSCTRSGSRCWPSTSRRTARARGDS